MRIQKSLSFAKYIQSSPILLKFFKPVANAYAQTAGYRQFGLRYDDLLEEENFQTQKVCFRSSLFLGKNDSNV